jgi:hypothetical protein
MCSGWRWELKWKACPTKQHPFIISAFGGVAFILVESDRGRLVGCTNFGWIWSRPVQPASAAPMAFRVAKGYFVMLCMDLNSWTLQTPIPIPRSLTFLYFGLLIRALPSLDLTIKFLIKKTCTFWPSVKINFCSFPSMMKTEMWKLDFSIQTKMINLLFHCAAQYTLGAVLYICVVHLQDKVTPLTTALWPGASFQNRSYWDRSSLLWIREDTFLTTKALWPGASFQNRSYRC